MLLKGNNILLLPFREDSCHQTIQRTCIPNVHRISVCTMIACYNELRSLFHFYRHILSCSKCRSHLPRLQYKNLNCLLCSPLKSVFDIFYIQKFKYIAHMIPSQTQLLHSEDSDDSPLQYLPPFWGLGLVQDLVRTLLPPPQLTLHSSDWLQLPQPPSTFKQYSYD